MGLLDRINEFESGDDETPSDPPSPERTSEAPAPPTGTAAGSAPDAVTRSDAPPPPPNGRPAESDPAAGPGATEQADDTSARAKTHDSSRSDDPDSPPPLTGLFQEDEIEPTDGRERRKFDRRAPDRPRQEEWERMKSMVRSMVREDLAPILTTLSPSEVGAETRKTLTTIIKREKIQITPVQRRAFVRQLMSEMLGLGPLDELLADPTVTEIMCNRFSEIWVERNGRLTLTEETFASEDQYRAIIQRIVAAVGRRIDESSPMVDARLQDGSRVNVIIPPLALDGSVLTIRKFPDDALTVHELIQRGVYTEMFAYFMRAAVRSGLNILISGGTGSGKTTTLNIMSSFIPRGERIVTIEDSAELQLQQPHVVRLESRPANAEGAGMVAIRDLLRNALRMRPNRLVIGECRGGEALDLLQAINTGHDGSMATIHANSARDAVKRLETLVMMAGYDLPLSAIREQIASAVHLIVQVERLTTGERIVRNVSEIQGSDGDTILMQEIMAHTGGPDGYIRPTGLRPRVADQIAGAGHELPPEIFRKNTGRDAPMPQSASPDDEPMAGVTR